MSELKKTSMLAGGALALALIAALTAPRPSLPGAFSDRGDAFFPDFDDPSAAATLEVVAFDEEAGTADAFKVVNADGNWTIPSHHDYPADGKDRLARTAAGVIGIVKDDFRSDNVADHAALGVLDPLDEGITSLEGRGKRVTLKDARGTTLADFIIGKQPEGRTDLRFVRIPGQKRVYASRVDVDISTRFEDWIEKDLLQLERGDVQSVLIKDYSIDERTGMLDERDEVALRREGESWAADGMRANQEIDSGKMSTLLGALDDLKIVGVRPKPTGLSATLAREPGSGLTSSDVSSLQSRGYYFTRDGRLVSNEGELQVRTEAGVSYTLRFGEVVYGTGEAVTSGAAGTTEGSDPGPGENRYLFITADFETSVKPEPPRPSDTGFEGRAEGELTDADRENAALQAAHQEWEKAVAEGREKAEALNARFADWYYVIAADAFEKVHLGRKDLVKAKSESS
jgi:hypothetical protein